MNRQTRFFSYTETNDDEVSLVLDSDSLAIFESTFKSGGSAGNRQGGEKWRAIEIGEGEHEQQDSTGLASSVSGVLAEHGISIFCMYLFSRHPSHCVALMLIGYKEPMTTNLCRSINS
jgi:hypothetical protein